MTHSCVDWTARSPTRKTPLLILTHGDDRVYTIVPKEFKTLEEVARREFNLGNGEIIFSSSCMNLCDGLPARVTESAWEHISPYIGCATVEVSCPRAAIDSVEGRLPQGSGVSREEQSTSSKNTEDSDERNSGTKRKLPSNADDGDENEQSDHGLLDGKPDVSAREVVRDEQNAPSVHGNGHEAVSAPEGQHEEPWEEESAIPPRKSRSRRRVVSEVEDEGEESEREHEVLARTRVNPIASPPKPRQPSKEVQKDRDSGYRSQLDAQSAEPLHQPSSKPIKQEKHESGSGSRPYSHDGHLQPPHVASQYEAPTQTQVESSENHKLMIRVAHRPSKQESKFTTKSTTKVAKVLAGACKSFGLDVGRATMYLIVSMEDEDGEVENLFPCNKNDTIVRAGAERDTESRFLLKMAGEA